jgi:hypothetical protein
MLDPLGAWVADFATLAPKLDSSWAVNFANWYYGHIVNNELTGVTTAMPPLDFQKLVFAGQLSFLGPVITGVEGAQQFADAWQTADNASIPLRVSPGDSVGAATPPTTWSVVNTAILDGSGIAGGHAVLMTLATVPQVLTGIISLFPSKFKTATETLTGSVDGLNSAVPTVGPLTVTSAPIV